MQKNFTLDTDAVRFVTWLRRFPRFPFGYLQFPVGEGRELVLHPPNLNPPLWDGQGPVEVAMAADYHVFPTSTGSEGREPVQETYHLTGTKMIIFEVTSLNADRIEVVAQCVEEPPLLAFFQDLLKEIDKRWPSPEALALDRLAKEMIFEHEGKKLLQKTDEEDEESPPPWDKEKRDHQIMELWKQGLSAQEIGDKVGLGAKAIYNRLSELRKEHGKAAVPYRKEKSAKRKKKFVKDILGK